MLGSSKIFWPSLFSIRSFLKKISGHHLFFHHPQVFDSSPMGKSVNATAMSALFDIGDDDGPTFKATRTRNAKGGRWRYENAMVWWLGTLTFILLFVYLIYIYIYSFLYLSISIYLSTYLPIYLSTYLSIRM